MEYFDSINSWIGMAQIIIIVGVTFLFYNRFIRKTNSEKLVRGLFGLLLMWLASFVFAWMGLNLLSVFTRWVAMFLSIGLVVIFQPELRKFLGMMGQINFLRALFMPRALKDASAKEKLSRAADNIARAAEYMSAKHTGALIVFQNDAALPADKAGTTLDADVSSELLLTIFFDKTPLHDGAVIISGARILSAGAILPLTDKAGLNWKYGTRHRAAIGMSENSDAHVLVVSEETGEISIAHNGALKKYEDMKKLKAQIGKILEKNC